MKIRSRNIGLLIFLLLSLSNGRDLVLLGFDGQGAPSAEKTYDRILREHLAVTPGLQLADLTQSQRFKRLINFDTHSVISKDLIETLGKYVKDTTYFAWGTVREFKISPERKFFFQAQIKGELTIELNIYSFIEHTFSYSGTIRAIEYKDKGLIFFSPISKTIHVSALEQTEILEKLEYEAVRKTCQMISATLQSETTIIGVNTAEKKDTEKATQEVLTTPSVEAPEITTETTSSDTPVKNSASETVPTDAKGK